LRQHLASKTRTVRRSASLIIWALASSADVVSRGALREPWEVTTPVAVLNGGRGRRITG